MLHCMGNVFFLVIHIADRKYNHGRCTILSGLSVLNWIYHFCLTLWHTYCGLATNDRIILQTKYTVFINTLIIGCNVLEICTNGNNVGPWEWCDVITLNMVKLVLKQPNSNIQRRKTWPIYNCPNQTASANTSTLMMLWRIILLTIRIN